MKKLLAILIAAAFAMPAFAADKKPVAKKEVRHHKKFEGTAVPTPPPAPAKKAAPKKK